MRTFGSEYAGGGLGYAQHPNAPKPQGGNVGPEGGVNEFDGNPLRGDNEVNQIYGVYDDCVQLPLSFSDIPTAVFQNKIRLTNNAQEAYVGEADQGAMTFTVEKGYVIGMNVTVGASPVSPEPPNYPPQPPRRFRDSMNVILEEGDSFLMAAGTGKLQLSIIRNQREYVNQGDIDSMVSSYNGRLFWAEAKLTLLKKCKKLGQSTIPEGGDDDGQATIGEGMFVFTDDQRFLLIGMGVLAFGSRYIVKRGS